LTHPTPDGSGFDDVEPIVDLAPGAGEDALAQLFATLVQRNLEDAARRRDFVRLRASIGVVADDAGTAITLRFDFGKLTIHEGLVGVPTITIRGATADIERLSELPHELGLRVLTDRESLGAARAVLSALRARRLKIYGLYSHPRLVLRLLRVLSRRSGFDGGAAGR
jgi:hypothetical protein